MSNQYTSHPLVKPFHLLPDNKIELELTRGKTTIIDAIDSDVSTLNWSLWTNGKQTYARRWIRADNKRREIRLHSVILERKLGRPLEKGEIVDHVDGNGLNNCRDNLRLATSAQNAANRGINSNSKAGFKGVFWLKSHKKWRAEIRRKGQKMFLGYFDTPEAGHEAYKQAASNYDGEFVRFK